LAPVRLLGIYLVRVLLRDALVETDTTAADLESLEAIGAILRKARHSRGVP